MNFTKLSSEVIAVFYCALSAAFMIIGYEMVRSPANTLFKEHYGADNLPFVVMLVPLFLTATLYVYGKLLSRWSTAKVSSACIMTSAAMILICFTGLKLGIKPFVWGLFIVKEIYIVLLIELCWSYINSVFTCSQGARYNGYILALSTIGGILGGVAVHHLAPVYSTLNLVPIAALLLMPSMFFMNKAFKTNALSEPTPADKEQDKEETLGLLTLFRSRTLTCILFLIVASQIYGTLMSFHFQGILQQSISEPDQQTSYSGLFFASVNGLALILQIVVAPILIRALTPMVVQLLIPIVHIAAAITMVVFPSLYTVSFAFLVFKSLDYSLFRASKEVLYIPLSFNARYRSKEIIDVLGYRGTKGMTSLAVGLGSLSPVMLASGAIATATLWFASLVPLTLRNARTARQNTDYQSTLSTKTR